MNFYPTLVTAPSIEPVSLAEAKLHLKIDHTDEDAFITSLLSMARFRVEEYCHVGLLTQTWALKAESFPNELELPYAGTLQSVTHVKYLNPLGVLTTLNSSEYFVSTDEGKIYLTDDFSNPELFEYGWPVTITYVVGATAANLIPERFKHAIKILLTAHYENREGFVPLPQAVKDILYSSRRQTAISNYGGK